MSEMMLIPKADLVAGYNAIRAKGVAGQIKSGQLADKINSIPSGSGKPEQTKTVSYTSNGSYTVSPDVGKTLSKVNVSVNVPTSGGGGNLPSVFTPGDFPIQSNWTKETVTDNKKVNQTLNITVAKTGRYKVRHISGEINLSYGEQTIVPSSQVYVNGVAKGELVEPPAFVGAKNLVKEMELDLQAGDKISVGLKAGEIVDRGYHVVKEVYGICLELCIDWNPFA